MARIKLNYREGTWFAVPLQTTGYAVGLVARMDGKGCVFGYFFGPKRDVPPSPDKLQDLDPKHAAWIGQFGDLGLIENEWPIICQTEGWEREKWPLPPFVRVDELSNTGFISFYSDEDLDYLREEICHPDLASKYPEDVMSGSGAVEIKLTMILDPA